MSIQTEISRITTAKNKIKTKVMALGLADTTAKIDTLATAIESIADNGAVQVTVQEGDTYTIPKGYHNGSGTVSGVAGGGNYNLQSKSVTPTKTQINVTPDNGYYGLSDVTVGAIPAQYQDVSDVTATASDVLANKVIVTTDGSVVAGTMVNNGAVSKTLDATTNSYTVPKGYHSGTGTVKIVTETKTATPTKAVQNITPTTGKVLSKVTVNAIPANYITTDDADAIASNILIDKTAYVDGVKVEGTMPNNGNVSTTFDGLTTTSVTIDAGYTSGGTISLTSDIADALASI